MFIAQLRLLNFKSFGKTHDLELHPGFTGIVGPNGSGKSNLLDALRWVLGENNPSRLRITRQSDLIFQGSLSLSRAQKASAKVRLQKETEACELLRSVDDSGGSVEVDGLRCRLGDLDEVKHKWHLDGERFAFIGQGEVAEIVRQRPKERRLHLEGLFGIDLYRKRRDEATSRLEEAMAELHNMDMLEGELQSRRELLLPEAAVARQVRDLTDRLLSYRRAYYWVRRKELETSLEETRGFREAQQIIEAQGAWWIQSWETLVQKERQGLQALREQYGYHQALLGSRGEALEGLKRRIVGVGAGFKRTRKSLVQTEEEIEKALETLEEMKGELHLREEALDERSQAEEAVRLEYHRAVEAMEGRMLHAKAVLKESEEIRTAQGECHAEETTLRGRLHTLGKQYGELYRTMEKDTPLVEENKTALDVANTKVQRITKDFQDATLRYGDAYALYQGALGDLRREERLLKDTENRIEDLRDRLQGDVYPRPVQHILGACKLGRLHAEPVVAAETFDIPQDFVRGIEAYLGGRLFWLFVQSLEEAQLCIEQLRKNNKGRATFLPLAQARPRSPMIGATLPLEGVCGWAAHLITPIPHWEKCVYHLLGDLLVVEDYGAGSSLAKKRSSFPVVTLEGDVFLPSGTVSGGSTRSKEGAMGLRQALRGAEEELQKRQKTVQDLTWSAREAEDHERQGAEKKEHLRTVLSEAEEALLQIERDFQGISQKYVRMKEELAEVRGLIKEGAERVRHLRGELQRLEERLHNLPPISEELEEERRVMELQKNLALAEERRKNGQTLLQNQVDALKTFQKSLDKNYRDKESLEAQKEEEFRQLRELGMEYRKAWKEREAQLASREEDHHTMDNLEKRVQKAQTRWEKARENQERTEREILQIQSRAHEMEREKEELLAAWEEEFPYTPDFELQDDQKDEPESLRRKVRSLEREIRNLGDVNLGALSEVEALEERISFLEDQIQDVRRGAEEMEKFIKETDIHAGTLFAKALEDIDSRFNGLFQRLFGGGEARLSFGGSEAGELEGERLWDAGVEVIARPPGKQPQHLGQLSGGEQSLTGISLLFAAMEIAGVPLAVLDEVDAALDEVNLQRFARLAKEYSQRLQIIAMTHRRYTMEKADLLYGVTMSEPGLSQVVGVRLEDWE